MAKSLDKYMDKKIIKKSETFIDKVIELCGIYAQQYMTRTRAKEEKDCKTWSRAVTRRRMESQPEGV